MIRNYHLPFGIQLVYDRLINLHGNNHHCCHGNKYKNPRWPPSSVDFLFLIFFLTLLPSVDLVIFYNDLGGERAVGICRSTVICEINRSFRP